MNTLSIEEKQNETTAPVEASGSGAERPKQRRRRRGNNSRNKPRQEKESRVAWDASKYSVPVVEGKMRFQDFNLPDVVLHAIADQGFEYATGIQAETIPTALAGKDIIGKAQTGTGKTAAFLLGIITDLLDFPIEERRRLAEPRALIVAPTRELAMQIAADAEGLSKHADLHVVSLVGGMDYDKQRQLLKMKPVDILVATPGRLLDFVNNKEVDLWNVEVLVLDEADRMLSMGFIPDVRSIIRATPRKGQDRQTLLYSATFSDDIMNLARQWTLDAVQIEIEPEKKTTDNVAQKVFLVSSKEKYKLLRNYIRINNIEKVIVFGNRRHETRSLSERLQKDGIRAALMSGEITQQRRIRTLEDFRSGKIQVLVATDVAGRGIHIDGVTHVINYQLPDDPDDYVHRIGRTGRAGASGTSICFACEDDSFMIPEVEAETGVKLECVHPDEGLLAELN
ncbi:MAG: ATP-dependent RNA helicase RhlB [Oceanospirillaceae bacterium]|nr:ATP-dependent RNA helicase RhlB [Oceanospirillaceae bacterium]